MHPFTMTLLESCEETRSKGSSKPFCGNIQFAHVLLVFSSRPRWAYNGHDLATEFTGFWNLTTWNEQAGQMIAMCWPAFETFTTAMVTEPQYRPQPSGCLQNTNFAEGEE